jgi:hypothetical protein
MEFYGPPIILTDEERLFLRAEIDAAMFILYGIVNKDDLEFILNTFSTLRKKEESKFGIFKTKQLIFQIYDKLVESSFALNQKQSSISSASSISLVMR